MNKVLLLIPALLTYSIGNSQINDQPVLLNSKFIDGGRFYLKIATTSGDTLLGYGDTGGGFTAVFPAAIDKAKLNSSVKTISDGNMEHSYIKFGDLVSDKKIPPIEIPFSFPIKESIFLIPDNKMLEEGQNLLKTIPQDIFLGQFFFLGKAWTFDYLNEKIYVNTPVIKTKANEKNIQYLGLKKDSAGNKLFGHPSIKIIVDGDTLDMLFDTGASFILTDSGKTKLNTEKESLAGSFIARSVYDKWISRHPDWKIFSKSDMGTNIIEVPEIKIGQYIAGPVLFSVRPDEAWSEWMIKSMDKVVKGAVGGSALKFFKVKADYNNELIEFTR